MRDAARPALHSHAARGNEGILKALVYNDERNAWERG